MGVLEGWHSKLYQSVCVGGECWRGGSAAKSFGFYSHHPLDCLQLPTTPIPEDPKPSSGFPEHQYACNKQTFMQAKYLYTQTYIHVYIHACIHKSDRIIIVIALQIAGHFAQNFAVRARLRGGIGEVATDQDRYFRGDGGHMSLRTGRMEHCAECDIIQAPICLCLFLFGTYDIGQAGPEL